MSKYKDSDAAKDTGASGKQTAEAHHDARTDSGVRDGKDTESLKSAPDWAKDAKTESGIPLTPQGERLRNSVWYSCRAGDISRAAAMPLSKLKIGALYEFHYRDASYAYVNLLRHKRVTPGTVKSVGRLRRVAPSFIDIALRWQSKSGYVERGLVIPRLAVLRAVPLSEI